jgi:hypothetical protein
LLGVVVLACNPSAEKAKARVSQTQGQPGLHSKTQSQKKKKKSDVVVHAYNPTYSGG